MSYVFKNKLRWIIPSIIWTLGVSIILTGCDQKKAQGPQGFSVNVVGFKSRVQSIEEKITLVGSLEAQESIEIKSEIDGKIEEVAFQEGQKVKKGDVLYRIDQNKLKAALSQAEADLKLAKVTAERYEQLVKTLAVSKQEYDQVVANLESGQASFELAKEQMDDAIIIAPFDGTMGERLVSEGQYISQGTRLGFLVNYDPIKAAFHLPERFLGEVAIDQAVTMKVAAYTQDEFTGTVYFIDPKIDETTRTALMKAMVPNPEGRLRPGMFANLNLIVQVKSDAVVIPETALMMDAAKTRVFTVGADNIAHLIEVQTGLRFDGLVEITKGLKSGDVVVIEGTQKIREGAPVQVRLSESFN